MTDWNGGLAAGKVVVVTGAAGGIGQASAELFAAEDAAVVVAADIDLDGVIATVEGIEANGGNAEAVQVDVTDPASVDALIDGVVTRHGRIDAAHNNAGIRGADHPIQEMPVEEWNRMIAVNLTGVFLCLRRELDVIGSAIERGEQTGAAIINTSSGAGVIGTPGLAHYVAAKHGVVGLTKTAAIENARRGIRVNAVLPGLTDTPMVRSADRLSGQSLEQIAKTMGRGTMGQPIEIAQAAVWLCSDRASFVSGESMLVDGATVCR